MEKFKHYNLPKPKFDAYNPELSTQFSLGSDRGRTIKEKADYQSANYDPKKAVGWRLTDKRAYFSDITIANRVIGVTTNQELEDAVTLLTEVGGGEIRLAAGTYVISTALAIPSSVRFVGDNASTTIIVFTGSANFTMTGGSVYTTGTVSINQGSTSLTGSGTTFTSAMVGQQIFLSNRWYEISAFGSTTALTLSTAFADANLSGSTYRISSVIKDVEFQRLTLVGASTTKVIDGIDVRDLSIEDVIVVTSGASGLGIELDNIMSFETNVLTVVGVPATTSHGIKVTNGSFVNFRQTATVSNGGSGVVWDNVKTSSITFSASNANTADGYNFTTVIDSFFIIEANGNGGQGVELVSGSNRNRFIPNISSNTSDGIKLTATSDNNLIFGGVIVSNGGYGVNIAASSCDNTNITANTFASNSSGAVNDSGTGTIIRGNIGVSDNETSANVSAKFGGSGADDALSITSDTTTINLANAAVVVKNYSSISITGTGVLAFSNPHANGTIVILKSTGAVTLTSSATPMIDCSSLGATAASDGLTSIDVLTDGGTAGTARNAGTLDGGNGGIGGVGRSSFDELFQNSLQVKNIVVAVGGGGAAGGAADAGAGAAGGRGGGALVIECKGALNFTTASGISVAGANGTAGTSDADVDDGGSGGGGGGGGGTSLILYNTLTAASGTVTVSGGTGGNGGTGGGGSGGAAGSGGAGGNGVAGSSTGGTGGNGGDSSTATGAGGGGGGGGGGSLHGGSDGTTGNNGDDGTGGRGGGGGGGGASGISIIQENLFFV